MYEQISLFDGNEKFIIDKPIRLIELFAGYGSQALSLKYNNMLFEHHKISEWAVKSIRAYKDMHFPNDNTDYSKDLTFDEIIEFLTNKGISANYNEPMTREQIKRYGEPKCRTIYNNIQATHNLVSVTNIKGKDLDITETDKYCYVMSYSFPCFTADNLVLTNIGYKSIAEIKVGDLVLTHDNTYKKVTKTFDNGVKPILKINAMAVDEITCTNNHRFYVRTMSRVGHLQHREFSTPYWKQAKDLTKKDYLGVAINQNSIIPKWEYEKKSKISSLMSYYDFWWIIGRYIGDGWIRSQGGIIISCPHSQIEYLKERVEKLFHCNVVEERTACKIHIPIKELGIFVEQFGRGAINKKLTSTILDLPTDLLKGFLEGYQSADGYIVNNIHKISTISRELVYGTAQCVAKVYKTPYKIYKTVKPPKHIIEGRIVNQHDIYELVWKEQKCKQDKAFYEDGYVWYPIKAIEQFGQNNVYDIEVENNHSFTVQNTIVHNCQDLSSAGLRKGMDKDGNTRSGLLWEVERILNELSTEGGQLPQVLLMENVPEVIGSKNIHNFAKWVEILDKLGYKSKWQVLNAKDYGIPQNRNRCFMVSILGDYWYEFPKKIKLEHKLKDLLEDNVDEKYYLSNKIITYYINHSNDCIKNGKGFRFAPTKGDLIGKRITTRAGSRMDDNFIYEQLLQEKEYNLKARFYKQAVETLKDNKCAIGDTIDAFNKKVNKSGCSPTLTTRPEGFKTAILPIVNDNAEKIEINLKTKNQHLLNMVENNKIDITKTQSIDLYNQKTNEEIIHTIRASVNTNNETAITHNLRIRKLTPKECFRLMGVKDEDFERVAKNQSNSSLYHLAGDSIVVNVLMAIFNQMR